MNHQPVGRPRRRRVTGAVAAGVALGGLLVAGLLSANPAEDHVPVVAQVEPAEAEVAQSQPDEAEVAQVEATTKAVTTDTPAAPSGSDAGVFKGWRAAPRAAAQTACLIANGFDPVAYDQRVWAEQRANWNQPRRSMPAPTPDERAAATAAARACRGFEVRLPDMMQWVLCLDKHGVVVTYLLEFPPQPASPEQARAAGIECRPLRPAWMQPWGELDACIDEQGLYGIPVADPAEAYPECSQLLPPPPPDPTAWEQCLAEGGFPSLGTARSRSVDHRAARAAADVCAHLTPASYLMPSYYCLAKHGIHLHLLAPRFWPAEEIQAAGTACGVQWPDVPAAAYAWPDCLDAANGLPASERSRFLEVTLEVARGLLAACAHLDPRRDEAEPEVPPDWQPYFDCRKAAGILDHFPGRIIDVDPSSVEQRCATLKPRPPPPPPLRPWQQCLADHGFAPPYALASIDLDRAAAALEACAEIEESPGHRG